MLMRLSNNFKRTVILTATIIVGSLFVLGAGAVNNISAQSLQKIVITLNSAEFVPLTKDPTKHRIVALVDYDVKDLSFVNTQINGVMHVYAPNGTQIKTTSYPNGFLISQAGTIQFATGIPDSTITNAKVDVALTDLNKTETISNLLVTNVTFTPPPS